MAQIADIGRRVAVDEGEIGRLADGDRAGLRAATVDMNPARTSIGKSGSIRALCTSEKSKK
ncbi:MAG TPA: hypothetical protein VGF77_09945 [Allosphingosinicella sp.]